MSEITLDLKKSKDVLEGSRKLTREGDLKSDGKYDTRAVEASYLAGANEKRVRELEAEVSILKEFKLKDSSKVELGAIVKTEKPNKNYFILNVGAGKTIEFENESYQILSTLSPLGSQILGFEIGISEVMIREKEVEISIIEIY